MRYAITLTKMIVVHVEAEDDADAREKAINEANDAAEADGAWFNAMTQIAEVTPT